MGATRQSPSIKVIQTLWVINAPVVARGSPRFRRGYATAANSSKLKPLILEKPDKFRPPSHPSRKPSARRSYGPQLTEEQLQEQKTRKYPAMMPPEGSFKFKVLTSRGLHLWISLGVLFTLTGATFYMDFKTKNHFPELMPPTSLLTSHPIQYFSQWFTVYRMHKQAETAENYKKQQRKNEEVRKRKEFMRAHGLEHEGPYGLGTVEGDEYREQQQRERENRMLRDREQKARETLAELKGYREREKELELGGEVRGWDGETSKAKKWFGIW